MTGEDLYNELIEKRDYSGNMADEYAQTLLTIRVHIGEELFPILERAHRDNKTLQIAEGAEDYITKEDVLFI